MRQSHRLIWNSIVIWMMRVIRLVPEIFLIPFIIHRLGEDSYGIFILAWSVLPILNLVQNGMGSALVKYSAEHFEKKQTREINKLLSSSCLLSAVWGLTGGVIVLIAVNVFPQWLAMVSPKNTEDLRFACNVMGLMVIVVFPLMPFAGILHALQRYDIFSLVNTIFAYIRIGSIVAWFLMVEQSLRAVIVLSAVSLIAMNIVFVILAFRRVPFLKVYPALCDRRSIRRIFKFGAMVLLTSVCILVNTTGVNWMMGFLVSPAFVGIMAIMLKPSQLIREIVQAMSLSVMPATSKYTAVKDKQMLRELFTRGTRYMALIAAFCWIGIVLMTRPALELWMGPDYTYLALYGIILASGTVLWMSGSCAFHMLRGMGLLRASVLSEFTGLVLVSLTSIVVLFKLTGSPFISVSIGLSLGQAVGMMMRLLFCIRELQVNMRRFLVHAFGQTLGMAFLLTGIGSGVMWYFEVTSLWACTAITFIVIGFFSIIFYYCLSKSEKSMIKDIYGRVYARIFRRNMSKV